MAQDTETRVGSWLKMESWKRKLRMGMVGGGQGAFIGWVHRIVAAMDQHVDFVSIVTPNNPHFVIVKTAQFGILRNFRNQG